MKALVLCGHPDDGVIASGGTIRKIVNTGGTVDVVAFGNGDESYARIEEKDTVVETFKQEAEEAYELLGVDNFQCLDYSDFAIKEDKETYRLCIKAIRDFKPDVIFSHYWAEYFQHRAMARLACDSWWQARWNCAVQLGEPWTAKSLYHFEVLDLLPEPTHIIDISETFEVKMAALRCFHYLGSALYDEKLGQASSQVEARARFHGSRIGTKYAEALKLSSYLPRAVRKIEELI